MGDENHILTLEDYSKPSHKGYMNTIELPEGNSVVPLRSDTIRPIEGIKCKKAWATIDKLAQYEDEGWDDPIIPEEGILVYENPNIEHLLGAMTSNI
nr:zinc finger, CCHC-type [Tanacetum cinerariifolium]